MFSSSALLAPRTKRWAEAKVLADCLTVKVRSILVLIAQDELIRCLFKVCKMYLYLNEPSRSVAQLSRHVARFHELSATWGLGEQTFEYWSWLSKQWVPSSDSIRRADPTDLQVPSLCRAGSDSYPCWLPTPDSSPTSSTKIDPSRDGPTPSHRPRPLSSPTTSRILLLSRWNLLRRAQGSLPSHFRSRGE